jgi:thiamine-phosphate pyrophosphorylase
MATLDPWGLADRRLYLCTPDRPDLEQFVEACIDGGVDIVQLREKHLDDLRLAERASRVQRVCGHHGVPFILNDRPDLAAAIGADGVHVGQDDASPVEARRLVGDDAIIGLSTHAVAELEVAIGGPMAGPGARGPTPAPSGAAPSAPAPAPAPVQYLSAGPVTATPTKPGRPGTGLGYVGEAVARSPWPVWVTGGADPTTVGSMAAAGARHFVVVRWLTEADDPEANARRLRRAIDAAIDEAIDAASP